jgi:hypothetical protein
MSTGPDGSRKVMGARKGRRTCRNSVEKLGPYSPEPKMGLPPHIRTPQTLSHLTVLVNLASSSDAAAGCGK